MSGWAVFGIVLAVFVLIGCIPVGVDASYRENELALRLKIWLFRVQVLPAKEKKKKPKETQKAKKIVAKNHTTCLMVTHNMQQALTMGNRTLMMDDGRIVFDVKGEERSRMTVPDLLEKFRIGAGKELDNDRILLSAED